MHSEADTAYKFNDEVPINQLPAGTNILVSGPAFSPAEELAQLLVTAGAKYDEGMMFISTNMTAKKLLAACQQLRPGFDSTHVGIVDCSGQEMLQLQSPAQVKYVSTQSDLTGIGMKFSSLYQSLYENVRDGRIRTGFSSLSSLAMYVDFRIMYRFLQTLSSRIDSSGGLGVFLIDPTAHEEQIVSTVRQAVDGEIAVRESEGTADGELRIRGMRGQPNGWQSFSLPDGVDE